MAHPSTRIALALSVSLGLPALALAQSQSPPPDHDGFGSNRSKTMNVIDSHKLERDLRKTAHTFSHPALVPDGDRSPDLLVKPYLTPSGQVVPKPGAAQTGPETAAERKAQRQSDKVLHSICSNC